MNHQLTFNMGALSGTETVAPFAAGDIVTHRTWGPLVIKSVQRDADAVEPEVLLCVKLSNGCDCVTFPREILYRSR